MHVHICPRPLNLALALAFGVGASTTAFAHPGHPEVVTIKGNYDNAVGSGDAASQGAIGEALLKSRPIQRPGAVLEFVPGVAVTQHAGEGKANQYFLRGFNLDHGTDFAVRINGIPVNLPSHGHGQGYADMNYLIPELVQRIQYRKGPYDAHNGDFSAAGGADIVYRRSLAAPFIDLTLGENRHRRLVAGASGGADSAGQGGGLRWLGAVEVAGHDGPWTVPEDLGKRNAVFTLSGGDARDSYALSLMAYKVRWVSTDQIPQRAVLDGRIGRFDSLDTTAGGDSHRHSLSGEWLRLRGDARTRVAAWAMSYGLDLNSNFTYALERPATGDQFKQTDKRRSFGLEFSHRIGHDVNGWPATTEVGAQLRQDRIRVGLFDSQARRITGTVREDKIEQTQAALYLQSELAFHPQWRAVLGLRGDHMRSRVNALTLAANSGQASDSLVSPKFSLIAGPFFGPQRKTEFFFNAGRGFHSNDSRGGTARIDPKTGDAVDPVPLLVPATGIELGLRSEWLPGIQTSVALWGLRFASELVYVGDAGATEASAGSRRRGIEINNRYLPLPWLSFDADFALSRARFVNGDHVPNSVDRVALMGLTLRNLGPWSASLQWRHLGSGALVEDNSVRSTPSTTVNLRLAYSFSPKTELTLDVFNLMNRKNADIQYFYESQLAGEAAPVEDKHFHPAQPRNVQVGLRLAF